ncbi:MAG: ribonuclease HI family protein [Thermoplasmata archaeon]
MRTNEQISLATDGASKGNPGSAAMGFSIYSEDLDALLEEDAKFIGRATNNEAEYRALIWALERGSMYRVKKTVHYSDSQLLVRQLKGQYSVRAPNLNRLVKKINRLKKRYDTVLHEHVPRENRYVSRVDRNINNVLDGT